MEAAYYGATITWKYWRAVRFRSPDMYFFFDGMMPAIRRQHQVQPQPRSDHVDDSDYESLAAYKDNLRLLNEWNGELDGRLIGDLCIHGEYTSTPKVWSEAIAAHAKDAGARIHIHLSRRRPSTRVQKRVA